MWLGVMVYTDGMDASFKKAKTKKEIIKWFEYHEYDMTAVKEGFFDKTEGIRHEILDEGQNVGYIVNLNAK